MRFSTGATAVLALSAAAAVFAAAVFAAGQPGADAVVPRAAPVPAQAGAPPGSPTASPTGDAAAKHAKRTACLKAVKAKKLVGADKASFLKNCIASS